MQPIEITLVTLFIAAIIIVVGWYVLKVFLHHQAEKIFRNEIHKSEKDYEKRIEADSNPDFVFFSRRSLLNECQKKYKTRQRNIWFISAADPQYSKLIGYVFLKKAIGFNNRHYFDLSIFHENDSSELFYSICSRLHIYNREQHFFKLIAQAIIGKNIRDADKENILRDFQNTCHTNNIGILFHSIHNLPISLFPVIEDFLEYSNSIVCASESNDSYSNVFVRLLSSEEPSAELVFIPPLDYWSYCIYLNHLIKTSDITSDMFQEISFAYDIESIRKYLAESHKAVYCDAHTLTSSKPFLNINSQDELMKYLFNGRLINRIDYYQEYFSRYLDLHLTRLSINESRLLNLLSLIPFAFTESDLRHFMNYLSLPYSKVNELLSRQMLFDSQSYQYTNVSVEMKLFEHLKISGEPYFENQELLNADKNVLKGIKCSTKDNLHGLRKLCKAVLLHPYYLEQKGFYTTELIRNIIIAFNRKDNLEKDVLFLVSYYHDKCIKETSVENMLADITIQNLYGCITSDNFKTRCNQIDSAIEISDNEDIEIDYYSQILKKKCRAAITKGSHYLSLKISHFDLFGLSSSIILKSGNGNCQIVWCE